MDEQLVEKVRRLNSLLTRQKNIQTERANSLDTLALRGGFQKMKPKISRRDTKTSNLHLYVRSSEGEFKGRGLYEVLFLGEDGLGYVTLDKIKDVKYFNKLASYVCVAPILTERRNRRNQRNNLIGAGLTALTGNAITTVSMQIECGLLQNYGEENMVCLIAGIAVFSSLVGTLYYTLSRAFSYISTNVKESKFEKEYSHRIARNASALEEAFDVELS